MSAGRPRLTLHVGQHKTGSKALQSFLARNRGPLRDTGLLYPAEGAPAHGVLAYAISQFRLYALLRREALAEHSGPAASERYWLTVRRYCEPFDSARPFFDALAAETRRAGAETVVVSAEDLFDMHTAHELDYAPGLAELAASRLAALAGEFGFEPRVAVYVRRQDDLLGAHYVQFIKGSTGHDHDFATFAQAFAPRLETARVLGAWARAFGRDRVVIRPYEGPAAPGGIVPDFFARVLGRPVPPGCSTPPANAETVNRSLSRDYVEFLRVLNRRLARGQTAFDRGDVLAAALSPDPALGIASWLSPRERRDLLAQHDAGNAAIARDFLGRDDGRLFPEVSPEEDAAWVAYPGFTAERATAVALSVHEAALARVAAPPCPEPPVPMFRRLARRLTRR